MQTVYLVKVIFLEEGENKYELFDLINKQPVIMRAYFSRKEAILAKEYYDSLPETRSYITKINVHDRFHREWEVESPEES